MNTMIGRWSREAVVARLAAFDALESADLDPATKAERKVGVLRIIAAVETGAITADEAVKAFARLADGGPSLAEAA